MRAPIKSIFINTSKYGLGNIFVKIAAFLLIPLYTKFLTPKEIGTLAILEMVEFFIVAIIPAGIGVAMGRYTQDEEIDKHKVVYSSAFWGWQFNTVLIISVLLVFSNQLTNILNLAPNELKLFQLMVLNAALFSGNQFLLTYFQYKGMANKYITVSIVHFIGILFITILMVIWLNMGLLGVLYAKLIINAFIYFIALLYIIKQRYFSFSFNVFKKIVTYGFPLIIPALVTPVLNFSDRFFLAQNVSLSDIGIYSIAYKFGMIINMILVVPLQRSWMPLMFKEGEKSGYENIFKDILFYYTLVGSFLFILISSLAPWLIKVFTAEIYLEGVKYIPFILFAYLIAGYRMFFQAGAALKNKTKIIGGISAIIILLNILLNYFLVKYFAVNGAVIATLISYLLFVIMTYYGSRTVSKINWFVSRNIKALFILVIVFIITPLIKSNALIDMSISFTLFITFLIITRTIPLKELNKIKTFITGVK